MTDLSLRADLVASDVAAFDRVVVSTGFFSEEERAIVRELTEEALSRGADSGYLYLVAELDGRVVGFSCFGAIPATRSSFDLYWIVVDDACRGHGIGQRLMQASEEMVRQAGGTRLYVDTAGREQYRPTHAFYERCGYHRAAELDDFYAPGDGKITFLKILT